MPGNMKTMISPRSTFQNEGNLKDGSFVAVNGIVFGVVPPKTNLLTRRKSPVMISFSIDPVGTSNDARSKLFRRRNAPKMIPISLRNAVKVVPRSFCSVCFILDRIRLSKNYELSSGDRTVNLPSPGQPGTLPAGFPPALPVSYVFSPLFVSRGVSVSVKYRRHSTLR